MGMIKRILRQTSHKILAKLGAQRGSHELNGPIGLPHHHHIMMATRQQSSLDSSANSKRHSRKSHSSNKRKRRANKELAIPEALLLAAKSYLPPVQFHHVHGPNAQLSKNKFVARRTQSFCQALVFSNRVILPNERVYIKVLDIAKGWSGTIRFGFTSVDPATLRYQMPKHACPDMTNAGHTWARALADEVVRRNSVIHFSYTTNGFINYGINNQDCGIFFANVNTSQHLWFIVDIYGLTAAVELIDPRVHNATGEIDFSKLDEELRNGHENHDRANTMYKSIDPMDELVPPFAISAALRPKKKRSRKATRQSALIYEQWSPQASLLMTSPLNLNPHQGPPLPNLNSIILPTAQQNIYSPMPNIADRHPPILSQSHDYSQIMTNERHTFGAAKMAPIPSSSAKSTSMSAGTSSSALNTSSTSTTSINGSSSVRSRLSASNEHEICQQLDGLQMSDRHGQQSASKALKHPVAAARRRLLQNNPMQTTINHSPEVNLKDQTNISHKGNSSSSSSTSTPSTNLRDNNAITIAQTHTNKPKTRHLTRTRKSSSRDKENSSPASKDCPICFERPINCVLYQCGHMCTCYECGVKQWRTQSRTCPICRTVIKDVIKTYMS